MALWGVLIDILKTAATHAAPHVARTAVDMARERMNASAPAQATAEDFAQELSAALAGFDQRLLASEQRAAAAEQQLIALRESFDRKWERLRLWLIGFMLWNGAMLGILVYVLVTRR
ncbi:MAG TPA: hypothetical protein VJN64_07295 [Terriglobales bacterium]|nr:hypothetical protein [Terriglobales bacterium]